VLVGTKVKNPEGLGPGLLARWFPFEETYVGLDTEGVEDAGMEAGQDVDVALVKQLPADGFYGSAFEEDIGRPTMAARP
jgi:hypothetical protein